MLVIVTCQPARGPTILELFFGSFELFDFGHTLGTHFVCSHRYCFLLQVYSRPIFCLLIYFLEVKVRTGCMRLYHCGNVVDWVVFAQVIVGSRATNGLDYTGIAVGRGA